MSTLSAARPCSSGRSSKPAPLGDGDERRVLCARVDEEQRRAEAVLPAQHDVDVQRRAAPCRACGRGIGVDGQRVGRGRTMPRRRAMCDREQRVVVDARQEQLRVELQRQLGRECVRGAQRRAQARRGLRAEADRSRGVGAGRRRPSFATVARGAALVAGGRKQRELQPRERPQRELPVGAEDDAAAAAQVEGPRQPERQSGAGDRWRSPPRCPRSPARSSAVPSPVSRSSK